MAKQTDLETWKSNYRTGKESNRVAIILWILVIGVALLSYLFMKYDRWVTEQNLKELQTIQSK